MKSNHRKNKYSILLITSIFIFAIDSSFCLSSCSNDSFGRENSKDCAVTGTVINKGATSVEINGFFNLGTSPSIQSVDEYGVKYDTDEKESEHILLNGFNKSGNAVAEMTDGTEFKVRLDGLRPNTTYKYLSYINIGDVSYFGETRYFTTDDFINLLSKPKIDVNNTFATISANVDYSRYEEFTTLYSPILGFFLAENKDALNNPFKDDGENELKAFVFNLKEDTVAVHDDDKNEDNDCASPLVCVRKTIKNLDQSKNYYYRTFSVVNGFPKMSEVDSFKTSDTFIWQNITYSPYAYPFYFTAILASMVDMDKYNDKLMTLGFAWSKNKDDIKQGGKYNDIVSKWQYDGDKPYVYANITGLEDNTTYYYCAYTKVGNQYKFGDIYSFTTLDFSNVVNVVSNPFVVNATYNSAELKAFVDYNKYDKEIMTSGFAWSKNKEDIGQDDKFNEINSPLEEQNGIYSISANITGLENNTTYYCCTFTKVGSKYKFGDIVSFNTLDVKDSPNIISKPSIEVSYNTATLKAKIDFSKYYESIMTLGFAWSINKDDFNNGDKYNLIKGSLFKQNNNYYISASLSNLEENTTYYCCTYTEVGEQYKFGDIVSFTTKSVVKDVLNRTKFIIVQGGSFSMGSTDNYNEQPIHRVTLNTFRIGETEVTQELWEVVMGSNPSYKKGDKLPVEQVSWNDCQAFIKKLNSITGKRYRLPTEAEWEFAARGGVKSKGYVYSGGDRPEDVGWYSFNSGGSTHPVGSLTPNELGIFDMSGNVSEWCQDWYGEYSHGGNNPTGPLSGTERVERGGGFLMYNLGTVSFRSYSSPNSKHYTTGFRLAL